MNPTPDIWKDIIGFNGRYQVSYTGEIRSVYKNGKTRILAQFKKSGKGRRIYRDRLFVKLTHQDGTAKNVLVHQIVANHYLRKPRPGEVPYHINGVVTDNYASNMAYITKKELGKKTGKISNSRTVVKLDDAGEPVDIYYSAREAARQNYMSYQTVIDRCNGKCKSAFAPDGYAYSWDDKESLKKAKIKIEKDAIKNNRQVIVNMNPTTEFTDDYPTEQVFHNVEWQEVFEGGTM